MTRIPYFPPTMPAPTVTGDTRPFWEACRRHELVVQRCAGCRALRHPPSPVCWRCRSFDHDWVAVSGRGTVFTHAVVHRAFLPELAAHVPYTVVVVALDDAPGVRVVSNLVDAAEGELAVGLPVEVWFDDVTAEVSVPRFRVRR
jgi:uncharacterized OB-fold protein